MNNKYRFFLIGLVSVMIYLPTEGKAAEEPGTCKYQYVLCLTTQGKRGLGSGCEHFRSPAARNECGKIGAWSSPAPGCREACKKEKESGNCKGDCPS